MWLTFLSVCVRMELILYLSASISAASVELTRSVSLCCCVSVWNTSLSYPGARLAQLAGWLVGDVEWPHSRVPDPAMPPSRFDREQSGQENSPEHISEISMNMSVLIRSRNRPPFNKIMADLIVTSNPHACLSPITFHPLLVKNLSSFVFKIFKDFASTAFCGREFQRLSTLREINISSSLS